MKYSKNILLSFLFLVIYIKQVNSQSCKSSSGTFPSKCFEITSILVDACDNSGEGRSEMVWLAIGNNPLLVSDFSVPAYVSGNVNWGSGASNSWRGFCNYTSPMLSKLSQINTAISNAGNCGVLIPKGYSDTLPARSNVLIITSSDFNSTFSFDNLNDTLYVILQTAGNTTGHFANYGSGTRRLIIHNNSCGDTVTYNRGDLVNQSGSHASGDGALANFDFAGNDYYSNSGCSVPIDTSHLSINSINKSYCSGTSVALKSNLSKIQCFVWQSSDTNAGYFSDTTQANPSFNINQNFSGLVTIYLRGKSNCRTLVDSVVINVTSSGIAYAGRDTTLCSTVNIPLNGDTTGVGGIKWLSTGQGSFSNDTLLNPIYTPAASDTGGIWLMIRLKSSCATTLDSMFYLVTQVNMKIDAGHDTTLCPNNSLQLYGNTANAGQISWASNGQGTFSNDTILNPIYTPSLNDTLVCLKVTINSTCGSSSDSLYLHINDAKLNVNVGNDTTICSGSIFYLKAQATSGAAIKWTTNGSGTFSNDTITNPIYTPSATDTLVSLKATIKLLCGTASDILNLHINKENPMVYAGNDTTICSGMNLLLQANYNVTGNILWTTTGTGTFNNNTLLNPMYMPSSTDSLVYLKITAQSSCKTVSDSLLLRIIKSNKYIDAGRDTILCTQNTLALHGQGNSSSIANWMCRGNGTFSNTNILNPIYYPSKNDTGNIWLVLRLSIPCGYLTDSIKVYQTPPPDASFNVSDTSACVGDPPIVFKSKQSGGQYKGSYITGSTFNPQKSGKYTIMHTISLNGCSDTSYQTINVYDNPVADFNFSPSTPKITESIYFQSTGSGASNYSWMFGDISNSTSSQSNPTFSYSTEGIYTVSLIVKNSHGCSDSISKKVTIASDDPDNILIPNVFTPNGDHLNDSFEIYGPEIDKFDMYIYNRWGELLFESHNIKMGWDGFYRNSKCSDGVYYYIIEAENTSKFKNYTFKGSVTLIR